MVSDLTLSEGPRVFFFPCECPVAEGRGWGDYCGGRVNMINLLGCLDCFVVSFCGVGLLRDYIEMGP